MGDSGSISQILWSADPATQRAIWTVLGAAIVAIVTVYGPLAVQAVRLYLLERAVREQASAWADPNAQETHASLRETLLDSPIRETFEEFERRWTTSQLGEKRDRAPIRLIDVFDDRPLMPLGPRRSLLPILPGLFLGLGVFAALIGLIPSLASLDAADSASEATQSTVLAAQLGLALRATAWGFLCAIFASLGGRLIEGSFNARSYGLDALVERAFGSVSPGELAELTRQAQQQSIETLGRELTGFANELNERLDRGLQRIEQSTSRAASLVSQEQRGALHTVVQELSLSVRQGVEHHLGELRGALGRAIEHQTSVTGGLAETFERMVENSQLQDRVARTLGESANSVEEAARAMRGSASEMQPVLEHLGTTSRALADTADRIGETQQVVARTAEGVRSSLEHAASGVDDQRKFIEISLGEIRRALVGLGDGLGDSLQRSLREVDDALGSTVGQLRDTLAASNETIERLSGPIRSAEGATRETHVALDRVRGEVEALAAWMNQALKPLRSGLVDVDGRAEEISRAITEFTNHTRQIDKTMEALREEIHEESRRLQGAGSELGRRLDQTSNAVGLLETTTSRAARRARPDAGGKAGPAAPAISPPVPPTLSPPPQVATPSPSTPPTAPPAASPSTFESAEPAAQSPGAASATSDVASDPKADKRRDVAGARPRFATGMPKREDSGAPRTPVEGASERADAASESTGRDLALSGYRMGAPRAKGPDPYARFDDDQSRSSNVRHFPTPERELGDDLKLSGLLGPSGPVPERDPEENADGKSGEETTEGTERPRSDDSA